MLEIPEANVYADQINATLVGKTVMNVTANASPHKFAWFYGDPNSYHELLSQKCITGCKAIAGQVEIEIEDCILLLGDGAGIKYYRSGEELAKKHQLLIEFTDFSSLTVTISMYGGIWAFKNGENENPYYLVAKKNPNPMTDEFDLPYFNSISLDRTLAKLSAKAFLATEQRIPGLGNGVLQDILFHAGIHPKRKMATLEDEDRVILFESIKSTLFEMFQKGGRDTERDFFGCNGGYQTICSKNTVNTPCKVCGTTIKKEAYMGGSVYYCEGCQK